MLLCFLHTTLHFKVVRSQYNSQYVTMLSGVFISTQSYINISVIKVLISSRVTSHQTFVCLLLTKEAIKSTRTMCINIKILFVISPLYRTTKQVSLLFRFDRSGFLGNEGQEGNSGCFLCEIDLRFSYNQNQNVTCMCISVIKALHVLCLCVSSE